MGYQWHQLDNTQIVCTSLQTANNARSSSLNYFRGLMFFLMPNKQCQSTEGKWLRHFTCFYLLLTYCLTILTRKKMHSPCADDTCCWRLQWSLGMTAQEEPVPDRQRHRLQSSWQQWWRRSSADSAPQTCMPRRTAKTTAATCSGRSWRYPPSPSAAQCDSVQNSPLRRTAVSCWPSGAWT